MTRGEGIDREKAADFEGDFEKDRSQHGHGVASQRSELALKS